MSLLITIVFGFLAFCAVGLVCIKIIEKLVDFCTYIKENLGFSKKPKKSYTY